MHRTSAIRCFFHISFFLILVLLTMHVLQAAKAGPSNDQAHSSMSMPDQQSLETAAPTYGRAKYLEDKRESEFNHRLAGVFVIVAGLFVLFQREFTTRWPWSRYIWPAVFLISGVFLTVWSDTELWPFGQRHWIEALRDNPEVRQHKTYALLLLILGLIEWLRANEKVKAAWSRWVFPFMAIAGSVLLLFHQHEGGMHGPEHIAVMERIQSEHLRFALAGFAIGLTNIAAGPKGWRGVVSRLWPVLMLALGVLLLFYRE